MKMTHPASDHVVDVIPARAEMYRQQGWREATPDAPAGNASLAAWQNFARTKGFEDAELEGKTRDELRAALS